MEKEARRLTPFSWGATGALCCIVGGIGAAILGSVLTAITWIVGGEIHPLLRGFGTFLLILTIPLLILAGYWLDWIEGKSKKSPPRPAQEMKLRN